MVRERTYYRIPEALRPYFSIDAQSLDEFTQLLQRESAQSVNIILDVEFRRHHNLQRYKLDFQSQAGEKKLRLHEGAIRSIYEVPEHLFQHAVGLTALDRISRIEAAVPGIQTRLLVDYGDGNGLITIDQESVAQVSGATEAVPFPIQEPEAA